MRKTSKKYTVKIPKSISLIYCKKKKIITFFGSKSHKSMKLKLHVYLSTSNKINISSVPLSDLSNNEKKMIKSMQGTTVALMKQILFEISTKTIHKKLNFVGLGYRIFFEEFFNNQLLLLKLGFSHLVYFFVPYKFKVFCKKRTQLFVLGNSYQDLTHIVSLIRNLKRPEPYKGKGILYEHEKVVRKQGKKI